MQVGGVKNRPQGDCGTVISIDCLSCKPFHQNFTCQNRATEVVSQVNDTGSQIETEANRCRFEIQKRTRFGQEHDADGLTRAKCIE